MESIPFVRSATVGLSGSALGGLVLLVLAALGEVYLNLESHWKQVLLPKASSSATPPWRSSDSCCC
jgi:hypothetical protein